MRKIFQRVVGAKSEEERKKYFDDIQELITNVQFAYDEGDFGEYVEILLFKKLLNYVFPITIISPMTANVPYKVIYRT